MAPIAVTRQYSYCHRQPKTFGLVQGEGVKTKNNKKTKQKSKSSHTQNGVTNDCADISILTHLLPSIHKRNPPLLI